MLLLLVGLLAAIGWLTTVLLNRSGNDATAATGGSTASRTPVSTPALEQVLPSVTAVELPEAGPRTPAPETPRATGKAAAVRPAGPTPGSPCADDMIAVEVRAPATVPSGSKPRFELVVRNVSDVPCARDLDKELQELVLLDADGRRVWGSNDCFPERSDERRTIGPGNGAAFPIVWGGLTSEPTCAAERTPPPPGDYVLRGRLDATTSGDRPLRIS